jgi:hypothetical protein
LDGIDKVTAEAVQRVAKKYLVATNMTEGVLIPTGVLRREGGGRSGGEVRHAAAMPSGVEDLR